ncbi:MAG: SLC13 family permease [bacterium]
MSDHDGHEAGNGSIFSSNLLWLGVGVAVFIIIGFIVPTPQSLVDLMEENNYAQQMMEWGIADNVKEAADKTMIVLGIIPMAIIFFATEAIPIGLTGVLMPILAYFFKLLPTARIGKTFAGDAPLFLLGVLAMGVVVVEVGLHKRLATWILGWTKGFLMPVFVLCVGMSVIGSFISAHAMCAFMTPVMMAVYFGTVASRSPVEEVKHDPALAKFLLFALCFSLNVGGVGSPAAGGRNVIMMGFWENYNVPMDFFTWMKYGLPMVPILGVLVAVYMLVLFSRKIKNKDLTPGLKAMKEETKSMGRMKYPEYVILFMLLIILVLWIVGSHDLGLGGPALLALFVPVVFGISEWRRILKSISWDAWFMYCGALTLGALLKESGAALWLAENFLNAFEYAGIQEGFPMWVGLSGFSGLMTNFMSDAATTALLGPIVLPVGIMSGHAAEPWASGFAVAFATSFAHFLVVGTPNNAIVYGLGTYPDTGRRAIAPIDFVKYGLLLWVLCLVVVWFIGFLGTFQIMGFPEGLLETAQEALQSRAR